MSKAVPSSPVLTVAEIEKLLEDVFPQLHHGGRTVMVEEVGPMNARLRLIAHERHLRPGGTVSGPAMFTLADVGIWVAIFAHLGPGALDAVTMNLNINFLRKPPHGDVLVELPPAEARPEARGGRGDLVFGRRGGAGRPCGGNLCDPGADEIR